MKVMRRVALYVALPLVVVAVAGYGWYQWSDTGKRMRFEDRLATYCEGLFPPDESAVLADFDTEEGLPYDDHRGGTNGYETCRVGKTELVIARIPESARDTDGPRGVLDELRPGRADTLPTALGGGWYGYTAPKKGGVILECENQDASVVVGSSTYGNAVVGLPAAELMTATAVRAAERWDCEADAGGPIPARSGPQEQKSRFEAQGTCKGIPMRDLDIVHWITETPAAGDAPLESCVLGETKADAEELFHLRAVFGPFAQAQLTESAPTGGAGGSKAYFWATAECPGTSVPARFTITATEYVYVDKNVEDFARAALTAFAERSAAQHGCSDPDLPR